MRKEHDTALAAELKNRISREGPMPVGDYMRACLSDPEHGYYRKRAAIGAQADFVTAPEISQIFGELIGLWCAVVWQQMGAPPVVHVIELGPGRGTMLRDMLRAARVWPAFIAALRLHLVESNERLRDTQRETLAGAPVPIAWHAALSAAGAQDGPTIVIANEFLDALPVEQFVRHRGRWHLRCVDLAPDGNFIFVPGQAYDEFEPVPRLAGRIRDGGIVERCGHYAEVAAGLLQRALAGPLAALFIDYGHAESAPGDTLQAVSAQQHVPVFAAPGESDLSAAVDFAHFAEHFASAGGAIALDGPISQAEFLGRLGIAERASRLMAANASAAAEIESGVARLMAPLGMGTRFKALGIRSAALPMLPGFEG